jgi:hypothetical protein
LGKLRPKIVEKIDIGSEARGRPRRSRAVAVDRGSIQDEERMVPCRRRAVVDEGRVARAQRPAVDRARLVDDVALLACNDARLVCDRA